MTDPNHDDDQNDEAAPRRSAEMDELSAHLDRAWDLLQQGDVDGARRSADEAARIDAQAPEVPTLLGAIAAARGEVEEALAHFSRATELDPDFPDPLLHAAELHLFPLGDFDEAIRLCEEALELAEEEEEFLDALLLKAEAELRKGDDRASRETLVELPPVRLPEAQFHLRAGQLFLDLGSDEDLATAETHMRHALEMDPHMTDALHALGMVHEERGDVKKMVQAFLKVREADLKEAAPPWGVTRDRFEELAQEALAELPERLRALLENVPILAADYPAIELVAEGNDPRMMGFFSGIPYPEKSTLAGAVPHLDCVFLYQRNIEKFCRTAAEVEQEIRKTLLHETGHFFGLTEEELEAMGLG